MRTAADKRRRRALYKERVAAGLCGMCGALATEGPRGGKTKCDGCRSAHAAAIAANRPRMNANKRRWATENPDRVRAWDNEVRRFAQYGITPEQFYEMLARQGGRCAICLLPFTKEPHIDHDHVTKRVRGLLCSEHNLALGLFKDNPDWLRAAAAYIEEEVM